MIAGHLIAEAEAFLEVIFDHEDEDVHRLVYADWLEEHGEAAHAKLIRVQCEIARTEPFTERATDLWIEAGRAWRDLRRAWWFVFRDFEDLDVTDFERGFPKPIEVDWTGPDDEAVPWWPPLLIPRLTVEPHVDWVDELFGWPRLKGVRELTVWGGFLAWPGEVYAGLDLSHLNGLRVLDLSNAWLYEEDVPAILALLDHPGLSRLRELRLPDELLQLSEVVLPLQARFGNPCQAGRAGARPSN